MNAIVLTSMSLYKCTKTVSSHVNRDVEQIRAVFEKYRPTHVIHLAAKVGGITFAHEGESALSDETVQPRITMSNQKYQNVR